MTARTAPAELFPTDQAGALRPVPPALEWSQCAAPECALRIVRLPADPPALRCAYHRPDKR